MGAISKRDLDEPQWLRKGRIPSLDGLRAIAVLLVLFAHAHQTQGFPDIPFLKAIGRSGSIGVDLFFVISGYLITTLILRERDRTGRLAIGRFYLRRILRIVPAYASLLITVAVLQAAGQAQLTERDWIAATTYTVNFLRHPAWEIGHVWSLSIEEHFYLAWPFVLARIPVKFGGIVALGCLVFCFAGRWVVLLLFPAQTPMAELWTFTRMDSIAMGCLLAFLAWDDDWRRRLDHFGSSRILVVTTFLVLLGSLAASTYSAKFSVGISYSLNAICLALLLWAATTAVGTRIGWVLNHRAVATLGVASYSVYLWQQLFQNPHSTGLLCTFPLNIILATVVSFVSVSAVERPFLRLKERIDHGLGESSPRRASTEDVPV